MLSKFRVGLVCLVAVAARAAFGLPLTEPVGTTSAVTTATVTISAAGTLGSVAVVTQGLTKLDFNPAAGGSCTVGTEYSTGETCTVNFTFTPSRPGTRYGGVVLTTSATGGVIGTAYVSGTGTGPQVNFSPGQLTPLPFASIVNPYTMTVDAQGNLYFAGEKSLSAPANVAKETWNGSGYTASTIATDLVYPVEIAVDGTGTVWIADQDAEMVYEETPANGGYVQSTPFGRQGVLGGVAVDGNGNVYVASGLLGIVKEAFTGNGYAPSTVGSSVGYYQIAVDGDGIIYSAGGYSYTPQADGSYTTGTFPSGGISIALDADKNIYMGNSFQNAVYKDTLSGGSYTQSTLVNPGASVSGVTVDGSGNVYLCSDSSAAAWELDTADPPSLTFAATAVGSTSSDSSKTVTMINSGNELLHMPPIGGGNNPSISAGFTIGSSSSCPQVSTGRPEGTLAVGASCTDIISFTPVVAGVDSGKLISTDDSENAVYATQVVPLNGTGLGSPNAPVVSGIAPNSGPVTGGTVVTITGTLLTGTTAVSFGSVAAASFTVNSAASITAVSPAGTGTVDVTVTTPNGTSVVSAADQFTYIALAQTISFTQPASPAYAGTSVVLSATASSGLPVTYSVVSGPGAVSGSVLTYTGAGSVVVEADQVGNADYAAAPAVQQTVTATLLSEPVGTASGSVTTTVVFSSIGTVGSIGVLTQGVAGLDFGFVAGGTCTVGTTYAVGQTCTVEFNFNPTRPGLRYGGIVLDTSAGTMLANSYVYGVGIGPQVGWLPGVQSLIGSALVEPSGVTVDAVGNLYVSSYGSGVTEISVGGAERTIGSFGATYDVVVDGSGNLFVETQESANGGNTALYEVMAVNGTIPASPTVVEIANGFTELNGIAVDGVGDLYLANGLGEGTGDGAVFEVMAVNGTIPASPTIRTFKNGITWPTGVAVDQSGDVYESDAGNKTVVELEAVNGTLPASPVVRDLGSGFDTPSNVALDAANDVYLTDSAGSAVYEILAVNGSIPAVNPTIRTLGMGFTEPQGMVVDSAGNVFFADQGKSQIVELSYSGVPTLHFAATAVGSTSSDSPRTATIFNNGNAPLTYEVPMGVMTNASITSGFTIGSGSTCPQVTAATNPAPMIAAGGACTEQVSFTPVAGGVDNGKLVTADNALNVPGATQTVLLSGDGLAPANAVLAALPTTVYYGQNVMLTATVTPVTGTTPVPTGTVTFYDGTTVLGAQTLASGSAVWNTTALPVGLDSLTCVYSGDMYYATANCAAVGVNVQLLPTALTVTQKPDPAYALSPVTFTAHLTVNGQPAGAGYTVSYVFDGDFPVGATTTGSATTDATGAATFTYAPGFDASAHSVVVGFAQSATMAASTARANIDLIPNLTSMTLIASPNPGYQNQPVSLVATVANTTSASSPNGAVVFTDVTNGGAVPLGTMQLVSSGTNLATATLVTTTLTPGTHTIQAVYGGTLSYKAVAAVTVSLVILPQDFTLTANPPSITIQTEYHKSMALTLTSIGGFSAKISLECLGAVPEWVTCSFPGAPVFLPANGTAPATLTIDTDALLDYKSETSGTGSRMVLAGLLPLMLFGFARKRRWRGVVLVAMVSVMAMSVTACSGHYPAHTTPGTYTVTVQASGQTAGASAPTVHTLDVTLVVTP